MRYEGTDMSAKRCEHLFLMCARSVREMKRPCSSTSVVAGWMVLRALGEEMEDWRMQDPVEVEAELGEREEEGNMLWNVWRQCQPAHDQLGKP